VCGGHQAYLRCAKAGYLIHPQIFKIFLKMKQGSTQFGVASPPSIIDRHIVDARPGPSASSSRPSKHPLIFPRKRGRGH
jgi:hypothetical protein